MAGYILRRFTRLYQSLIQVVCQLTLLINVNTHTTTLHRHNQWHHGRGMGATALAKF